MDHRFKTVDFLWNHCLVDSVLNFVRLHVSWLVYCDFTMFADIFCSPCFFSFDEFMMDLKQPKRKNIRQERKKVYLLLA